MNLPRLELETKTLFEKFPDSAPPLDLCFFSQKVLTTFFSGDKVKNYAR